MYRASADTLKTDDNFVIEGNLTVNGTTTTVNSTVLTVDDKNIELASTASPSDAAADGGGITLRGTIDKTFNWISATSAWTSSEDLNLLSGKVYKINGTAVLSSTALGSGIVSSSLTSVGTISSGTWQASVIGASYIDSAIARLASPTFTGSLTAATPSFTGPLTSSGAATFNNRIDVGPIRESVTTTTITTNVITQAYSSGTVLFQATNPSANFTINLTGVPTDDDKIVTVVAFVTQGVTGYIPSAIQIDGVGITLKWANGGAAPTPTSSSGKIDIFSFAIIRRSSAWTAYGSNTLNY